MFMMWRAKLPFTIHIMKVPSSLLSAFMKKLAGSAADIMNVECKIENVHSHLLSTFMMQVANSNGFGIKRLRTSKACKK
jgi:hypothetical protein